jgi:hypothetical protein
MSDHEADHFHTASAQREDVADQQERFSQAVHFI